MPDLPTADQLIGTATYLLPGGEAVVHTNQTLESHQTYLVRQAVPGDILQLLPSRKQRGAPKASLKNIEKPSDKRVQALCDAANLCGACALQYLHAGQHSLVKSEWVHHAFQPVINHDTDWLPIQSDHDSTKIAYSRRRLRWHVGHNKGGQVILGFRAYHSHDVVEIEACMVVTAELESLRKYLQTYLITADISLPESIYAVQLSDGIHIIFEYQRACSSNISPQAKIGNLVIQYWCRDRQGLRPLCKPVHSLHDRLPTTGEEIQIHIGPDDFVQGQQLGNHAMIEQLLAWCQGERYIVDLFSGAGNLSLPLAASGMQVLGAEVNTASVRAANANAKQLGLDARYQQADLFGKFDVSNFVGADVLIVDPPRKGAKKICSLMNHLLPKKVILVHCDVTSAARDALEMQTQGYRLRALRALDLFPYSGHVESMSLWTR